MYASGWHKERLWALLPLSFLLVFVVACGSTSTDSTTSTGAAAATATCPPNRFKTTTGTLQSISSTSFVVKDAQGANVQASYTSSTRFQQEAQVATSNLKEGTYVSVAVTQDNGSYTATRVMLVGNRGAGQGFGNGTGRGNVGNGTGGNGGSGANGTGNGRTRNAACFRRGQNANAGAAGTANGGRNITGTVSQMSGNSLTVTDLQGSNYTLTLNGSTKIIQYKSATSSALKTGSAVMVTGADNGNSGITAQSITVMLAG